MGTELITSDRRTLDLMQLAKTVAQSKATVLIQGESGTGKELLATLIHESSPRANRPFIAINCAAIPENLLESELFGYERGAFTGAVSSSPGKFELAHGGTILLDEISEMDVRLQAKLLRVIQEGEVDRIGSKRPIPIDVRIVATTNKNLAQCVRQGTFREDLFYRLNVVNLTLPPLRERMGDVALLSAYFMRMYARRNNRPVEGFSREAIAMLEAHPWPGNARELENTIERAVLTARGRLIANTDVIIDRTLKVAQDLQREGRPDEQLNWIPGQTLNDVERQIILTALSYHQGNRTHTARALGISIRTLRNKLADYRRAGIHV